ncbi:MAG: hypothetical protein WDN31_11835 [Hyphomicrobium sp.]
MPYSRWAPAAPVYAQTEAQEGAAIGGTAGAATGGTTRLLPRWPSVGAIIGGFAGATLGAQAGVDAATVE